jgi:hypothetical protein
MTARLRAIRAAFGLSADQVFAIGEWEVPVTRNAEIDPRDDGPRAYEFRLSPPVRCAAHSLRALGVSHAFERSAGKAPGDTRALVP